MAANTRYNLNYLDDQYGISPADSEEEYAAAGALAQAYQDRGLTAHIQDFTTPGQTDLYRGILMIVLMVTMLLSNVGSMILGIASIIVGVVAAVALVADRLGYGVLTKYGATAHSQNVVAVRRGTGEMSGRGVRPVVIVAHYDSPTESLFDRLGIAPYAPMLKRLAPKLVVVVGVCVLLQIMMFLPDPLRRVIWIVGLVASLPLLFLGIARIYERRSSCIAGANNNKSGTAALLSIMDKVCTTDYEETPLEDYEESEPALIPVETQTVSDEQPAAPIAAEVAESSNLVDPVVEVRAQDAYEEPLAQEPVAAEQAPIVESVSAPRPRSAAPAAADEPAEAAVEGIRHGASVVRSLGLLPEGCELAYAKPAPKPAPTDNIDSARTGVMPVVNDRQPVPASDVEVVDNAEEPVAAQEVEGEGLVDFGVDAPGPYGVDEAVPLDNALPRITSRRPRGDDVVEGGAAAVGQKISGLFSRVRTGLMSMTDNIRSRRAGDDERIDVPPIEDEEPQDVDGPEVPLELQETVADMPVIGEDGMPVIPDATDETRPDAGDTSDADDAVDLGATSPMEQVPTPEPEDNPESDSWGQSSFTPEPAPAAAPARKINRDLLPGLVPSPVALDPEPVNPGRRAALFDLPDPSAEEIDPLDSSMPQPPLADRSDIFTLVPAPDEAPAPASSPDATIMASPVGESEPISSGAVAPAPVPAQRDRERRGLFGRKKKRGQESMSSWLGVEDDYDAKSGGRSIGSWDNFDSDDDDWKGGATSVSQDGTEASQEDLVDAALSMGDEELLAHDIWFVSTGASSLDHAGMHAFLDQYRKELRGAFVINIDSVGVGDLAILSVEGGHAPRRADRRITRLLEGAASDIHVKLVRSERNWDDTDATVAMRSSMRSATIMGIDASGDRAFGRSLKDSMENVFASQVESVVQVVCEAIRRS